MPILLVTLLGAVLRFYDLGHQGLWYDESYTAFLVHFTPGKMIGLIPSQESTPPFYYCVVWVWARIFGYGPAALRSLSAVCGTLTIPIAYGAAAKLLPSRKAAYIVAALTATSPLLIWYSQEARAYSMLVLFCAASLLAFAYARERPKSQILAAWALTSALALATHYYAALVVVPEAAWLLYEHRYRRAVQGAIAFVVAVGLALLPLLFSQTANGNQNWITHTSVSKRLLQVPTLYVIGTGSPLRDVLKFIGFACVLIALGLLAFRSRSRERQGAFLPAGIALTGLLIVVVLLLAGNDTLLGRNLLPIWLPATVVIGAGLGVARSSWLGPLTAAVLCVIGLIAVIGVDSDHWLQRPNWQPVAVAVDPLLRFASIPKFDSGPYVAPFYGTKASRGTRLVIVQQNPGLLPLKLYLPGLAYDRQQKTTNVAQIDVIAVNDHPGLGSFCWWGSACNLSPSTLQPSYDIPGFHTVKTLHVGQFSIRVLAADKPVTVSTAAVRSALGADSFGRAAYLYQPDS